MQQNNDETLESPAEKDYHRYLDGVKTEGLKSSKRVWNYLKCDHYSKEETIQGRKLFAEIR